MEDTNFGKSALKGKNFSAMDLYDDSEYYPLYSYFI